MVRFKMVRSSGLLNLGKGSYYISLGRLDRLLGRMWRLIRTVHEGRARTQRLRRGQSQLPENEWAFQESSAHPRDRLPRGGGASHSLGLFKQKLVLSHVLFGILPKSFLLALVPFNSKIHGSRGEDMEAERMCSVNVTSMFANRRALNFVRSIGKYIFIEKRWQANEY